MAADSLGPSRDLEGVLVVAMEQAVAAPYASALLAAAGARVIKIERPDGDFARRYDRHVLGQSAYFVWLNGGKESVCVDLNLREDRALLRRMIARADVFLQNLKPGALEKWGLGSVELRRANPRLVTCDITGFGRAGPYAGLKAYDLIVQAEAGLCAITGGAAEPARVGVSICDIAAGVAAHAAILQALLGRARSGQGRGIEISLFDALAQWMSVPLMQHIHGGHEVARAGVSHPTIAPYGAFACLGGEQVIFSVQNQREWASFCARFMGDPALAADPRFADPDDRVRNRPVLDGMIAAAFRRLPVGEALARLADSDIAHGRLNSLSEAAHHPHLRFAEVATPAGGVRVIAPAALMSDGAARLGPVPACGQHSEQIRAEFADANMETVR